MKPPRSLLDPKFVYVNAASTDIRKTFAEARRRINQEIVDEQTKKECPKQMMKASS